MGSWLGKCGRGEEAAGPLDSLPEECVVHVLKFLPIADVFVCMSVNKTWLKRCKVRRPDSQSIASAF